METLAHAAIAIDSESFFNDAVTTKLIASLFIIGMLLFLRNPNLQNKRKAIEN